MTVVHSTPMRQCPIANPALRARTHPVASEAIHVFPDAYAPAGVYRASGNRHGALSVTSAAGKLLGVKPNEFERLTNVDWVIAGPISHCVRAAKPDRRPVVNRGVDRGFLM